MAGNRAITGKNVKGLLEDFRKKHGRDEGSKRFKEHLDEAFEKKQLTPHDFSIRELFENVIENGKAIVDSWSHPKSGWGVELLEAGAGAVVGYSDFSNITNQLIITEVLDKMDNPDFVFTKEIESKQSAFQDIEKIPGISRTGKTRSKIKEGDPYPRYGVSEDYIEAPAKVKDGGIIEITKEGVMGDRTGVLMERCGELGYDLAYSVEERVIDAMIDENAGALGAYAGGHQYTWKGTVYSTYQTSGGWINFKASNPLTTDETCVDALWQLLVAITDPYTSRPIVQYPNFLAVTPDKAFVAARLLSTVEHRTAPVGFDVDSTASVTVGPPALGKVVGTLKLLSSPILKARLATDTDWFMGNLRKSIRRYYNWEILTEQRGKGTEADFERDIVHQAKASVKDCVTTINPRYLGKSKVSA